MCLNVFRDEAVRYYNVVFYEVRFFFDFLLIYEMKDFVRNLKKFYIVDLSVDVGVFIKN